MYSLRKRTKYTFGQKSQPYDTSLKTWVKEEVNLSQQFIWMELLLERTTTISEEEKMKI